MRKIVTIIVVIVVVILVALLFMGRDGGETSQDSANPHAIQQE